MPRLTRRRLLGAGAGGAVALGLGAVSVRELGADDDPEPPPVAADERRNVLLIVIDSLRADQVGEYAGAGGTRPGTLLPATRTPNIDALARESLRFDLSVPETMPTGPARRAIYMARRQFPFRDWKPQSQLPQVPGWQGIEGDDRTWVGWAGRAGLTTVLSADTPFVIAPRFAKLQRDFTRVHAAFGEPPIPGEPKRLVGDDVLARYLSPAMEGSPETERLREFITNSPPGAPPDRHTAFETFRGARRELRRVARGNRPFALVIDTFGPHEPWGPPERFIRLYDEPQFDGVEPIQPFRSPFGRLGEGGLDERSTRRAGVLYAAEISFADAMIGQLLNDLDDLGLADTTTVLLTADHGVAMGEGDIVGKDGDNPFGELHHVPFMIRDAGGRRAGETSAYFASTHDIGPTLLSAAGVKPFPQADGVDLMPLFDRRRPPARPVFTAGYGDHVLAGDNDWLLLSDNQGREKRLYRRADQTREVAARHPGEVRRLWDATIAAGGGKPLPTFGPGGAR